MKSDPTGIEFVDEVNRTEAEVTKEQTENYLAGLVTEKGYNETALRQAEAAEMPDTARIKQLKDDLKSVEAELARVGDTREPRSKAAK